MSSQYESIKIKLKKLLALAERGVRGEAENARRLLEKLCKEHGISIEELMDENQKKWYIFDIGRNKVYKDLFTQCYCSVVNEKSLSYKSVSQSKIGVEMTAFQYAELASLFEWHKSNFNKDLEDMKENILLAYCRKHRLYSDAKSDDTEADRKLTAEEKRRLIKIILMQESLNDNQYRKLLEQGGKK